MENKKPAPKSILGSNLRYLRLKMGFSSMQILVHVLNRKPLPHLNYNNYSKWEHSTRIPSPETLEVLAEWYSVAVNDLVNKPLYLTEHHAVLRPNENQPTTKIVHFGIYLAEKEGRQTPVKKKAIETPVPPPVINNTRMSLNRGPLYNFNYPVEMISK